MFGVRRSVFDVPGFIGGRNKAVFAPIESFLNEGDCRSRATMKRPLEEASDLFQENEVLAGGDREKANLYRGLRLLAESLSQLEKELAEVESAIQGGPSHFYQIQHTN